MINYYEVISYCNKHGISVEEFFLLYRIYSQQVNSKKLQSFVVQSKMYQSINKDKIDYTALLKNLMNKDLISKKVEKDAVKLSNLRVTDEYIKTVYISKEIAFQEALSVFPDYMLVEGNKFYSKTSKEGGAAHLEDLYYKIIGGDPLEHGKFLLLVENKYKNKDYADQKFETLIINWKILKTQFHKEALKKMNDDGTKRV